MSFASNGNRTLQMFAHCSVKQDVRRFSVSRMSQSDSMDCVERTLKEKFLTLHLSRTALAARDAPQQDRRTAQPKLQTEGRAQKTGWKHDRGCDESKHAMNGNPKNAER